MERHLKESILNQHARALFFTGMPCSGKTTLAISLEKKLLNQGYFVKILDGDEIRSGLNSDLKFSEKERVENVRRVAEVAKMFVECGIITLVCLVSPTNELRASARNIIGKNDLIEIFVDCSLEECERRDVKGMYKKARAGEIKDFTGIDQKFENPTNASIIINTEILTIEQSVENLFSFIESKIKLH